MDQPRPSCAVGWPRVGARSSGDRALASGARGRRFESYRAYLENSAIATRTAFRLEGRSRCNKEMWPKCGHSVAPDRRVVEAQTEPFRGSYRASPRCSRLGTCHLWGYAIKKRLQSVLKRSSIQMPGVRRRTLRKPSTPLRTTIGVEIQRAALSPSVSRQ